MVRATILLVLSALTLCAQQYPFQNPKLAVEKRIDNLLSLMTLEEKIACLGTNPSVPRLGVVGSGHIEGLHGVALGGPGNWGGRRPVPTTQFPQAVGLGETWDPALLEKAASLEAQEARYTFQSPEFQSANQRFSRTGIVVRAPNADLARDPRWGRTEESYGEDPFLTGTMTVAFANGLQGHDPKYWQAASLMKHFLANSNEDVRTSSSSDFDERLFREYYSVPFRMGIELAGARAFMASYNAVNGTPMMISPILKDIVLKEWHFDGIISTDGGALGLLITDHKRYATLAEGAAAGIKAGINQFLDRYNDPVHQAISQHLLTEADLNETLRGDFRVMIHLGLLDPPNQVPYSKIRKQAGAPDPWDTEEHHALARRVTEESIVLLKNEKGLLPLDKASVHRVAVLGPRANEVDLDWYSGTPPYRITPLDGLRKLLGPNVQIDYVPYDADAEFAVAAAKNANAAIVFVGNHPTCNGGWSRCFDPSEGKESIDRKKIDLNPDQESLLRQVSAVNPKTIMVLVASFPYAINWEAEHLPAILHMANNSQEEGTAIAEALFGDINPGGRLIATWPHSLDQLPPLLDYNLRNGRTYMYFKGTPLFPFGYGLSYTTFEYGTVRTTPGSAGVDLSLDVKNTGSRAGDEVVQVYAAYPHSSVSRPNEQLIGFRRVHIEPGATAHVDVPLEYTTLRYWDDAQKQWVLEHTPVDLRIGSSSADIRQKTTITIP